jgi:CubicO group peptidase (beta-lactamase class C family)
MTVKAHAACVLIALVLAASVEGCTGPADQAPAAAPPAPTTLGSSAGPVSSADGTGSGTVEDRAARSDQLLATMSPDQPGCSAAVAIDGHVVWAGARGMANVEQKTPLTRIHRPAW